MINIIGAGMAGSILAKMLRKEGIKFRIFDSEREGAASRVSENLIGAHWYKGQEGTVKTALELLRGIVPVRDFTSNGKKYYHVYTEDLLEADYIKESATPFDGFCVSQPIRETGGESTTHFGFNVICAGYWSKFIADIDVEAVVGHGLILPGVCEDNIKPHLPFRFQKMINRKRDEVWFSDSLAVTVKTFEKNKQEYKAKLIELAFQTEDFKRAVEAGTHMTYGYGYRPHTAFHGNVESLGGLVITGGYKSGMLHYPIQCAEAVEYIKKHKLQ